MISGWLLKVVIGILLVGFAAVELGSPVIARVQADDAAHNIADEVALRLDERNTDAEREAACEEESGNENVTVLECTADRSGTVTVRVRKDAWSLLLKKWSVTEDWYHPEVKATATGSA